MAKSKNIKKEEQKLEKKSNKVQDIEKKEEKKENVELESNPDEDKKIATEDVKTDNSTEDNSEATKKDEVTEEQNQLEELQKKNSELNDKYLRLTAEFDNYRKRTLKEKMELMKSAGESLLLNILPIVDNFERALKSMDDTKEVDAIKEGVNLIYNSFVEFMKTNGVKEIEALNKEFDLDEHEALTKIPAPEKKLKGKVVDVIEKGYKLNDKVIRYSKVVVGE